MSTKYELVGRRGLRRRAYLGAATVGVFVVALLFLSPRVTPRYVVGALACLCVCVDLRENDMAPGLLLSSFGGIIAEVEWCRWWCVVATMSEAATATIRTGQIEAGNVCTDTHVYVSECYAYTIHICIVPYYINTLCTLNACYSACVCGSFGVFAFGVFEANI